MSEDKRPRFLQQTTSQLLHQQEALRKRREMLERESTKPPAMRFGTNTPPRNAARHGRSPLLSSSASERQTSHSTPPPSSGARRELNWSRPEDEKTAERAPMRFSMLFRPSPTPAVLARPRSATGLHTPSSPSLREVNTSDQVDARVTKFCKESSSPRTVSPHSPVQQRGRVECDRSPSENTTPRTDVLCIYCGAVFRGLCRSLPMKQPKSRLFVRQGAARHRHVQQSSFTPVRHHPTLG
ncbi:hypothetical_protein [Leishmania braziliensis MHOM/BR/75/M2904]|uniref:Hypothetical_protein n=1 Tax=Leishmania braziliensis MHOM/BR/75/M2904 TaxID=420245 RepID=A0A3P3ZEE3_LEIBR|nr:hypothetical_protein [Leishmania braziliensis MHOM/BR/75/M2904]